MEWWIIGVLTVSGIAATTLVSILLLTRLTPTHKKRKKAVATSTQPIVSTAQPVAVVATTPPMASPPVAHTPSPPQRRPFWRRAGRMIFGLLIWCSLIVGALWVIHEFVLPLDPILTETPQEGEITPPSDERPQTKEETNSEWNTTPYFGKMGTFILAIAIACVIIFVVIGLVQFLVTIPFFRTLLFFFVIVVAGGLIVYGPNGLQKKMYEWIEWANMPWGVTRMSSPPEKVIAQQYPNVVRIQGGEPLEIRIPAGTCVGFPDELVPLIKIQYRNNGRWYNQLSLGQDPSAILISTKDQTPSFSILFRYMRGNRGTCS